MGQTKTLSKKELLRITGVAGKQYKSISWHSSQLIIKPLLTLPEYVDTVHRIICDCTGSDGTIAKELLDYSIRLHVIAAYSFVEVPEDLEQAYYIAYQSDLYDTVVKNVNAAQIDAIKKSVQMCIGG